MRAISLGAVAPQVQAASPRAAATRVAALGQLHATPQLHQAADRGVGYVFESFSLLALHAFHLAQRSLATPRNLLAELRAA